MNYSNPVLKLVVPGWPAGHARDTLEMTFTVQTDRRGMQRVSRASPGAKSKSTVYAKAARIVTGVEDNRTYAALLTVYNTICIMRGNLEIQEQSISARDGEEYRQALELFEGGGDD